MNIRRGKKRKRESISLEGFKVSGFKFKAATVHIKWERRRLAGENPGSLITGGVNRITNKVSSTNKKIIKPASPSRNNPPWGDVRPWGLFSMGPGTSWRAFYTQVSYTDSPLRETGIQITNPHFPSLDSPPLSKWIFSHRFLPYIPLSRYTIKVRFSFKNHYFFIVITLISMKVEHFFFSSDFELHLDTFHVYEL